MASERRPGVVAGALGAIRALAAIVAAMAAGWLLAPEATAGVEPAAWRAPNPFRAATLFVDPDSRARRQITEWQATRPTDAALLERIAGRPQADWFTSIYPDIRSAVAARVAEITA